MKTINILERYKLFIQIFIIVVLLLLSYFLYYFYTNLNIKNCSDGTILSGGVCTKIIQDNLGSKTESGGEDVIVDNGYGTHYLNLGGAYSQNHDISKYKKIKINENIDSLRLFITVDFPNWFKEKYSYATSPGFKFALKYFFGEKGFDEEGGFYNVLRNSSCSNLINDPTRNLNGAIVGKDINGGYTRILDLTKKTPIASEQGECKPGLQYRYTDTLGFINGNISKELYVGGYLSHVGEGAGHGPIKGWEVSVIKDIKIEYIGNSGAIEVTK